MPPVLGSTVSRSQHDSVSKRWTWSSTGRANVTWHHSLLLYWPSVVFVASHAPVAAKLEEHTQFVVRSNTHAPVAVPLGGGCNGGEGGEGGERGGEGGEGGEGGGEGGTPPPPQAQHTVLEGKLVSS